MCSYGSLLVLIGTYGSLLVFMSPYGSLFGLKGSY